MKDVNAVLRNKELELACVRNEIRALLLVLPLLAEEQDWIEYDLTQSPRSRQSNCR